MIEFEAGDIAVVIKNNFELAADGSYQLKHFNNNINKAFSILEDKGVVYDVSNIKISTNAYTEKDSFVVNFTMNVNGFTLTDMESDEDFEDEFEDDEEEEGFDEDILDLMKGFIFDTVNEDDDKDNIDAEELESIYSVLLMSKINAWLVAGGLPEVGFDTADEDITIAQKRLISRNILEEITGDSADNYTPSEAREILITNSFHLDYPCGVDDCETCEW